MEYRMFNLFQKTKVAVDSALFSSIHDRGTGTASNVYYNDDNASDVENDDMKLYVYDLLKVIKDPEKNATLEDLAVIKEEYIHILKYPQCDKKVIMVEFHPTVPHCSLAALIGLCIRQKLNQSLGHGEYMIQIYVIPESHNNHKEVSKQINDKERAAAAMENPNLKEIVEKCIQESD